MAHVSPEAPAARPAALPSLPRRVIDVFVSPARLFQGLRAEPAFWGALLLGGALVALSNLLLPAEIWEASIRRQLLEAGADAPTDLATVARIGRVMGSIGPLFFWPILAVISAAVFSLVFLFVLGYEGSFRQYLAVTAHALLVAAVAMLVLVPLRILTQDAQFSLTMGTLVPLGEGTLVGRVLGLLDLFNLWVYGLIGLGAAVVDGGRKPGPAIAVAMAVVLLVTLLIAALMG